MNAATDANETFVAPAAPTHETRPFYWSVRRELWENRSLFIAPLVPAGLALLVLIYRAIASPGDVQALAALPSNVQGQALTIAYGAIAWAISVVMHITVFFYLLDALQGERKDRSVLFWKSMPVSDTTTVLSKLFTALIVSGAIVAVIAIAAQLGVLLFSGIALMIGGANPLPAWGKSQFFQVTFAVTYWQIAIALWYAPLAAWLLLVSAWAKRVTILWAVFTPIALAVFERVAIGTRYVQDMISYRLDDPVLRGFAASGARGAEFTIGREGVRTHGIPERLLETIDPVAFLSNPWLWVGLVVAAGFTAAAIWMRRYREPI
jgi:ABC-2 type transport system permease protein